MSIGVDFTDFVNQKHQWIWQAIKALYQEGVNIDFITVADRLEIQGKLPEIGGDAYLTRLIQTASDFWNAESYARIVKAHSNRRELIRLAKKMAKKARIPVIENIDLSDIANDFELLRLNISSNTDNWGEPFNLVDTCAPHPPVDFVVDGLYKIPSLNMLFGSEGDLKTMLMAYKCVCIAGGLPILPPAPWNPGGRSFPVKQVPVMYLDMDNGKDEMDERFAAICKAYNLPLDIPLYYYSFPQGGFDASNKNHIGNIADRMDKLGIKVLAIDNLGITKGRADENTDQMIPVMNNYRWLTEQTCSIVILIHHQRKNTVFRGRLGDRIRGHSSIAASLNLGLAIDREPHSSIIQMTQAKQRGYEVLPFTAEFTYTHKIGTTQLDTVSFFSLPSPDMVTDKAIDESVYKALKDDKLDQTQLTDAIKALLPEIPINRIRMRIDYLVGTKKIGLQIERHNRHVYQKV